MKWSIDVLRRVPCFFQVRQSQSAVVESGVRSELQNLREQLEKSEEQRKASEAQLSEANGAITQLQEEGKRWWRKLRKRAETLLQERFKRNLKAKVE